MASVTNLSLLNNAGVATLYNPIIVKTGEYTKYVDRSQGVLALQSTASLAYSESATHRKVSGIVMFPVLNPTTGLVEPDFGKFEFSVHKTHSATDRLDVRKRLAAFVADAIVSSAVDNGETPW